MSDAHCTWTRLSDGPNLTSHVTVILSQQSDFALIPGEGQTFDVTCPNLGNTTWRVSREQVNGNEPWSTSIYARGGDDFMLCSGYSPGGYVYCLGEQGNDFIKSWSPDALLFGHSGNDTLIAVNVAPYTILDGGDNDDWLSAPAPQPPNYICGPGSFDKSTGVQGGGCESLVSSCQ
jgi:Ca2+-binding RTX toxin-like protein